MKNETIQKKDKVTCTKNKISFVMKEFKNKELFTPSEKLVTNPKQAIAIALSSSKKLCNSSSTPISKNTKKS